MLPPSLRRQFDQLLETIIDELPEQLHELLEEVPLIVEDEPAPELLEEMDIDARDSDLCGLHWGIALTQRSVQHSGTMPDRMMLFRGPILRVAGHRGRRPGSRFHGRAGARPLATEALEQQIRITLLHEIGHHFGLDEQDLEDLGYG